MSSSACDSRRRRINARTKYGVHHTPVRWIAVKGSRQQSTSCVPLQRCYQLSHPLWVCSWYTGHQHVWCYELYANVMAMWRLYTKILWYVVLSSYGQGLTVAGRWAFGRSPVRLWVVTNLHHFIAGLSLTHLHICKLPVLDFSWRSMVWSMSYCWKWTNESTKGVCLCMSGNCV